MSKLAAFLRDPSKENALEQYALQHGHNILYNFRQDFDFANRDFLAMIDFLTNYDICGGVLIHSLEDICQTEASPLFQWFSGRVKKVGKSFYSMSPLENSPSPSASANQFDAIFLARWGELERQTEDFFRPIPRCISPVILEGKCFANCRMCFQRRHPEVVVNGKMNLDLFKKMLDDVPVDIKTDLSICSSTETLNHPELIEIIKYASNTKPRLWSELTTNGVLLDTKTSRAIIESRLRGITISVDAPTEDEYKWLVGIDTYQQVVKNAHAFIKLRNELVGSPHKNSAGAWVIAIPRVRIRMMGLKRFEGQVEDFMTQWRGMADDIDISPVYFCKGDPQMENLNSKGEELPIISTCRFLMQSFRVWPDGKVYLCCHQDWTQDRFADLELGNIQDTNLFTLWHSPRLNEIRKTNIRGLPVINSCLTCDANRRDFVTDLLIKSKLRKQFGLNSS